MTYKSRIMAADAAGIAAAVALLDAGGIVAVPTETVYGLAARAADGAAVARIYAAKGRPAFNPLIVHVESVAQAAELVEIDAVAAALMAHFWPGALTLVLPLRAGGPVAGLVTAGLPTLAVRCPAHPVMQALIAGCGPLAAPSANASGRISSTTAAHVAASLGDRVPLVLDGGACAVGVESTIVTVEADTIRLLRPGPISDGAIASLLLRHRHRPDMQLRSLGGAENGAPIIAPGMLVSHYAPRQPLRLNAVSAAPDEFLIGFGGVAGDVSLSAEGDTEVAASRLFELLHIAEASGKPRIAVAPIPTTGLGDAINDRLQRAAAPRDAANDI